MPPLDRTPSSTSTASFISTPSDSATYNTPRRTRKRFSNDQLITLENLFHRTSHPTRHEREAVAQEIGMDTKSITIWFQNKRQTERRAALQKSIHDTRNACTPNPDHSPPPMDNNISTCRPSLDMIASRSELREIDRTPERRSISSPSSTPWESIPSSPASSLVSPLPPNEYVKFGKSHSSRTLEWACAAARLAVKTKSSSRRDLDRLIEDDETDEDDPEIITPESTSLGSEDSRWTAGADVHRPDVLQTEDHGDDMLSIRYDLSPPPGTVAANLQRSRTLQFDVKASTKDGPKTYYKEVAAAVDEAKTVLGEELTAWRDAVGNREDSKETKKTLRQEDDDVDVDGEEEELPL